MSLTIFRGSWLYQQIVHLARHACTRFSDKASKTIRRSGPGRWLCCLEPFPKLLRTLHFGCKQPEAASSIEERPGNSDRTQKHPLPRPLAKWVSMQARLCLALGQARGLVVLLTGALLTVECFSSNINQTKQQQTPRFVLRLCPTVSVR